MEGVMQKMEQETRLLTEETMRQMQEKFIESIKANYLAIYEVDLIKETFYAWKSNEGYFEVRQSVNLRDVLSIYERKYVKVEFRKQYRKIFNIENMVSVFRSGEKDITEEFMMLVPGGEYHWVRQQVQLLDAEEDSLKLMIYLKDIHQRRMMEVNQQYMQMEATQLLGAVMDSYELLITANLKKNNYRMISYERYHSHCAPNKGSYDDLVAINAEIIPAPYSEQFIEKFSRENLIAAYEKGVKSAYLEHLQMGDDGKEHWTASHVMLTEDPYNDDINALVLARCIDDIKEKEAKSKQLLQEAVEYAEKASNAKTDFLSRMSHDIRTPMNAIIGMTAIASTQLQYPDKIEECLKKINASSKYLLSLINDILDLSRIESGKLTIAESAFDLREMLNDICSITGVQMDSKKQRLRVNIAEGLGSLYLGDELRVRQILMNLLSNAHKYTPAGGEISLSVDVIDEREDVQILSMAVRDNGIGISESFMKKLFMAFEQDTMQEGRKGSGLGLAIAKNLANLMDGTIDVWSKQGEGSCFTLRVPLKILVSEQLTSEEGGTETEEAVERLQEGIVFNGEHVLLVEDNDLNMEIASLLLGMKKLDIDMAVNGKEAVEKYAASEPFYYSAVLMDVQMPVMNGYEATRQIRAMKRQDAECVPIYAMTANAFSSDVMEALECGMNAHVAKPLDFDKIADMLKKDMEWFSEQKG